MPIEFENLGNPVRSNALILSDRQGMIVVHHPQEGPLAIRARLDPDGQRIGADIIDQLIT